MELCVASLELFLSHPTKTALGGATLRISTADKKPKRKGGPAVIFQHVVPGGIARLMGGA